MKVPIRHAPCIKLLGNSINEFQGIYSNPQTNIIFQRQQYTCKFSPCFAQFLVPMLLEDWSNGLRLIIGVEVDQIIVLEWASPTMPDLSVLPPPSDSREEGGVFLWT